MKNKINTITKFAIRDTGWEWNLLSKKNSVLVLIIFDIA